MAGRSPPLNPCSLTATGRLENVALALRADTIPGTRVRAASGEQYRVQSQVSLGLAIGRAEPRPIEPGIMQLMISQKSASIVAGKIVHWASSL